MLLDMVTSYFPFAAPDLDPKIVARSAFLCLLMWPAYASNDCRAVLFAIGV